jgi:drug/metabolite transporter (DMT)-like permease
MKETLLCLGVAALGNAVYHLGQRTLTPAANPMVLLMAVYALAFGLSAAAAPFFRADPGTGAAAGVLSWPVLVLAVGVVLIELGFVLAYRTGSVLQWSGVAVSGTSALFLVPIALLFFRESFSLVRLGGILLTLGGLWLLARS